jgi:hypothetical protein
MKKEPTNRRDNSSLQWVRILQQVQIYQDV